MHLTINPMDLLISLFSCRANKFARCFISHYLINLMLSKLPHGCLTIARLFFFAFHQRWTRRRLLKQWPLWKLPPWWLLVLWDTLRPLVDSAPSRLSSLSIRVKSASVASTRTGVYWKQIINGKEISLIYMVLYTLPGAKCQEWQNMSWKNILIFFSNFPWKTNNLEK